MQKKRKINIRKKIYVLFASFIIMLGMLPTQTFTKHVCAADNILLIDYYEVETGDFSPGSTATICFYLYNTGGKDTIKNVKVNLNSTDNVTPVYGKSNQVYIETILPGQKMPVRFEVDVPAAIESEKASVSLDIKYRINGQDASNNPSVFIPVKYDSELVVNSVSVADNIKEGAKALISMSYSNNGTAPMKDMFLTLDGNIEDEQKRVEMGNLDSGASQYKDIYVVFNKTGEQNLKLLVTYKDMDGNTYSKEIANEIVKVSKDNSKEIAMKKQVEVKESKSKNYIKIVVLLAIIGVGIGIVMLLAKKEE